MVEQSINKGASTWPTINPIPSLNPVLWYDFADESTVTVSSSQITQITNKGSINWTLTKSTTGPSYVAGINGLKCVDWGNPGHSNFLRNSSTTSTNLAEFYIVLDANFGNSFPGYNGLVTGTDTWAIGGDQAYTRFYSAAGWYDAAYLNGSGTNSYSGAILPTINSPSLVRVKRLNNTALVTTKGVQIGADRSFSGRGWGGLVGEVIAFSTVLNSSNRSAVEAHLALKWGLTLV